MCKRKVFSIRTTLLLYARTNEIETMANVRRKKMPIAKS